MNPLTLDLNLFFTSVLSKVYTNMMLGLDTLYEDAGQCLNHLYLIRFFVDCLIIVLWISIYLPFKAGYSQLLKVSQVLL